MNWFTWTLLLFQTTLFSFAHPYSSTNESCNYARGCGIDITQTQCEQRNCCYRPSIIRRHNCFQRQLPSEENLPVTGNHNGPSTTQQANILNGEMEPPDAFHLPPQMEEYINMFTHTGENQLTPAQALHIANTFEKFLMQQAARGVGMNWDYNRNEIFHALVKTDHATFLEEVVFDSGTTIKLNHSHEELAQRNITAIIIVEYLTMGRILKGKSLYNTTVKKTVGVNGLECPLEVDIIDNSTLLSVTAYDSNWNKVPVFVHFTFTKLNTTTNNSKHEENEGPSCQYIDETTNQWSPYGCKVVGKGQGSVHCFCNHTTKFSVLFVVRPLPFEMPPHHASNILVLEFVMEGLSFTCLTITMLSLFLVLRRRSKSSTSTAARERTIVHINFIAALAALHLVRLISEASLGNNGMCNMTVVLSHYFVLASGIWMLIEGLVLYLNLVVKSMKFNRLGWYKFAAGWGIPFVIVFISAVVGFTQGIYVQRVEKQMQCPPLNGEVTIDQTETTFKYCWLGTKHNMIWSATGPLIAIFIINFFILSHTVALILKLSLKSKAMKPLSSKSNHGQHLWHTTKGILVLFPILGVPWLIGFLVNIQEYHVNIVFQYIHVSLNGLQGVFIFIFYCAVNKEVREILYRVMSNKWDQHKLSASRSANNSLSARDRWKKSIQSIMNANNSTNSLQKQTKHNLSQYSVNTAQRASSGSNSAASTIYRTKQKYSTGSFDRSRMNNFGKPGLSCSLPRGMGYQTMPQVTRTPSTRSLHSENNSIPRICNQCGSLKTHSKLSRLDSGCSNCKRHNLSAKSSTDIHADAAMDTVCTELPVVNQRWHRMTAEEFKRFSSIPEEKRRSGVNSFYQDNETNPLPWEKKAKTIERTNVSQRFGSSNTYIVPIDVHAALESDNEKERSIGSVAEEERSTRRSSVAEEERSTRKSSIAEERSTKRSSVAEERGPEEPLQTNYFSMVRHKDAGNTVKMVDVDIDDDDDYAELPEPEQT